MSAVNLLSSLQEKPIDESLKDGTTLAGEDDSRQSGVGDPAVLAMGPARQPLVYTVEQLLHLRNSPLVKKGIDTAFVGCEALSLVLKKRSESPHEDDRGAKGDAPNENHKGGYGRERERRSADPRERVRKESEPSGGGIVLSPQRRSFTSGCGAPATAPPPPHVARTRPESPLSAAQPVPPKTDQAGRRIGSGRIMVRDVPNSNWEEGEFRGGEPYRPPQRDRDRDRDERPHQRTNGDRYERRSFNRDSYSSDIKRERDDRFNNEKPRDREDNRRSSGRFSQRRFEKEDEPEWFSGGPTSQLETIELRGFDEPMKKNGPVNSKENDKWNSNSGSRSPAGERWREAPTSPPALPDSTDTKQEKEVVESKPDEPQSSNEQPEFNLDEFLKFDSIPDMLTNGGGESEGGSRFSRWFRRESPTNDSKHYERLLHNMVDELDKSTTIETSTIRTSEAAHVFAPISPAGVPPPVPHQQAPPQAPRAPPSLLDLLRRANANADAPPTPHEMNSMGGKIHSLEELEARLRPQHTAPPSHPDHDLTAFKRLLAQVSGGHAVPASDQPQRPQPSMQPQPPSQPQPMSLLQMLNKSMEQQQKAQQQQQAQQPHIPPELLYQLLQVQQRQQQQQQQQQQAGELGMGVDRELLQRPEAQAIIHGLKAGEITVQHLIQQLSNPGLQSRHREVLLTILRLHQHQRQMGGSPLPSNMGSVGGVGGVPAPHLVVPPHHQPLRLSPLPHPSVPARIPSPRELAAHTQQIMQGALIKKKLEEQRENYRRRHEMQQQQPKQQPPISFTPTSVLRKMTADKESEAPSSKQLPWNQMPKVPQGRPIVKGNQSGVAPPMGYAPTQADYQQHYLNQQQMAGGIRPFGHPQQRQQVPTSLGNVAQMNRGVASGTTLHQLLMQSHQRSLNELGGVGAGTGGGDNQLARWFSPELLARASAGKLPSVHVPNALSLEDLERHHHSPAPPVRN